MVRQLIYDKEVLDQKITHDILRTDGSIKMIAKKYARSISYHNVKLIKLERYVERIIVSMRAGDMSNIPPWVPERKLAYSDDEMKYATQMREIKWEELSATEKCYATEENE